MKKEYQKPSMKVVLLKHRTHLLAASYGAKSLKNNDKFQWTDDMTEDDV
jgi:hypothetical protein